MVGRHAGIRCRIIVFGGSRYLEVTLVDWEGGKEMVFLYLLYSISIAVAKYGIDKPFDKTS